MIVAEPTPLCRLDEIADGDGRGFALGSGPRLRRIIVVRRGDRVHAYLNACPHAGTTLDWVPDQFFNHDRTMLVCYTHHAYFRVEDGYCVSGPCTGDELTALPAEVRDGEIVLLPD